MNYDYIIVGMLFATIVVTVASTLVGAKHINVGGRLRDNKLRTKMFRDDLNALRKALTLVIKRQQGIPLSLDEGNSLNRFCGMPCRQRTPESNLPTPTELEAVDKFMAGADRYDDDSPTTLGDFSPQQSDDE